MSYRPAVRSSLPIAALAALAVLVACESPSGGGGVPPEAPAKSSAKALTSFGIPSLGLTALVSEPGHAVSATVPYGTDRSSLVAAFETTGVSVTLDGVAQVSGTTANDFTAPRSYRVWAEDESYQDYSVAVSEAPSSAKALTAFSFEAARNPGKGLTSDCAGSIDDEAGSIAVTLPYGASRTGLVATFSAIGSSVLIGSVEQSSGSTSNGFTSPVTYTVVAADGSSRNYTVTVNVALNPAKSITAFRFRAALNPGKGFSSDCVGSIEESSGAIAVTLPHGSSRSGLIATFTTTGAAVSVGGVAQASGVTANEFASPLVYTVRAADGTTRNYTVTVTLALNPAKSLDSVSVLGRTGVYSNGAYYINLPYNQDVRSLIATFTYTGASVRVGAVAQVSGSTTNDATASGSCPPRIEYTVVAADGSTLSVPVYFTFGTLADFYLKGPNTESIRVGLATDGSNLYYSCCIPFIALFKLPIANPAGETYTGVSPYSGRPMAFSGSTLFFAENLCHRVARVDSDLATGLSILAGSTDNTAGLVDAVGTNARFNDPVGLATDGTSLYVCDILNHAVRRIVISTAAVTTLYVEPSAMPTGIVCLGDYLYVANGTRNNILKIHKTTGAMTVHAGSATGASGLVDGSASAARFSSPLDIACDGTYLYVNEVNGGIRRVSVADGSVATICCQAAFYDKPAVRTYGNMVFAGGKLYFWMTQDGNLKIATLQ